jgi:hypothetical protein
VTGDTGNTPSGNIRAATVWRLSAPGEAIPSWRLTRWKGPSVDVDPRIAYRILRSNALRLLNLSMPGFIGYTELSQQYAQQPCGYWVNPH